MDMGQYTFVDGEGNATHADYTFVYHKLDGRILIFFASFFLTWTRCDGLKRLLGRWGRSHGIRPRGCA